MNRLKYAHFFNRQLTTAYRQPFFNQLFRHELDALALDRYPAKFLTIFAKRGRDYEKNISTK